MIECHGRHFRREDELGYYILWSQLLMSDDDAKGADWEAVRGMIWAEFDRRFGMTG